MKNDPAKRERLRQILMQKSYLRNGPYTLSSGKISDVFFDVKMTSLDPEGATLAADLILDRLEGRNIRAIGGLAVGACPMVSAICVRSFERGMNIAAFYVRKEVKDHGTKKKIEGLDDLKQGDRVVIVDDVATKGGAMLEAILPVKALGCEIVTTMVIVDREEEAKQRLAAEGYTLDALFTRSELE